MHRILTHPKLGDAMLFAGFATFFAVILHHG
jgi:hypothetical protein